MDCVNHSGVTATAYCQNCGKPLCANCIRQTAPGQVLCDTCILARQTAPNPAQPYPFGAPPSTGPHPVLAAILGLIPGVGAMYNGQFAKGFIHAAIFAVLVSVQGHSGGFQPFFGILLSVWIFYQSFDAYHTAKARRDGLPLPDPLGLNEAIHNWIPSSRQSWPHQPGQPGSGPVGANPANPDPAAQAPGSYPPPQNPYQQGSYPQGSYQPGSYQQGSYQQPPYPPYPPVPPVPPVPPLYWRRREPVAAIVLIALGLLFLLGQFTDRLVHFAWPLMLICLGAWLIFRRFHDSQGGPQ